MPVKRRLPKGRAHRITPDLRPKAERYLVLSEQHADAIEADDDAFYNDGCHAELVEIGAEVHLALGICPWQDADAIVEAALAEAGG